MSEVTTELDIARAMVAVHQGGERPRPMKFMNLNLYAIRITGTGASFRAGKEEFVWRKPEDYLTEKFLARCNGLPVIFDHPETEPTLTSEEFNERIVGTIFVPYIVENDVWGIAKIFDDATLAILENEPMSTSPCVVLADGHETGKRTLDDGSIILIEDEPPLLDHIAICANGVWDKGREPTGVASMTDEERAAEEKAKADAAKADAQAKRDARIDAMCDAWEAEQKAKADAAKKDADDEEEKKKKEEEDKAKSDESEEEKKKREEAEKADAAAKKDADEKKALADKIAKLDESMPKALSDEEEDEMADAQHRADSVATALGENRRLRPLPNERPGDFRRRFAERYKKHSTEWAAVDLTKADASIVAIAESAIHKAALAHAATPDAVPAGVLRERVRNDGAGHIIREYDGHPSVWMDEFKLPRSLIEGDVKFNTKAGA
jgi:hypothetical protein